MTNGVRRNRQLTKQRSPSGTLDRLVALSLMRQYAVSSAGELPARSHVLVPRVELHRRAGADLPRPTETVGATHFHVSTTPYPSFETTPIGLPAPARVRTGHVSRQSPRLRRERARPRGEDVRTARPADPARQRARAPRHHRAVRDPDARAAGRTHRLRRPRARADRLRKDARLRPRDAHPAARRARPPHPAHSARPRARAHT